ncbi:MAG: hypothetical protein ACOX6T_15735 [Myxococcales bacterium]|jgi:hypothetical protein
MSDLHKVILQGPAARDDKVSGHLFRDLLDVLVEGSKRSLRFRLEGRSTFKGPQPKWLRTAADFDLLREPGLGASSAVIQARPLVETMPERFQQGDLFVDLDPRKSPVELFEDALEDALRGDADSERFDEELIATFKKFEGLLKHGIERIKVVNGRTLRVDARALERVRELARSSFAPQRVRVAGRLEEIRYSDCRFSLVLGSGATLQGTALDLGHEALKEHFGRTVVVTGMAAFRPSGRPLCIDAERIEPASERDTQLWSALPKPLLAPFPGRQLHEEQRTRGRLTALLEERRGKALRH